MAAPEPCAGCGDVPERAVALAGDGWMVGLVCDCRDMQPLSRTFPTQADALTALRILAERDN